MEGSKMVSLFICGMVNLDAVVYSRAVWSRGGGRRRCTRQAMRAEKGRTGFLYPIWSFLTVLYLLFLILLGFSEKGVNGRKWFCVMLLMTLGVLFFPGCFAHFALTGWL